MIKYAKSTPRVRRVVVPSSRCRSPMEKAEQISRNQGADEGAKRLGVALRPRRSKCDSEPRAALAAQNAEHPLQQACERVAPCPSCEHGEHKTEFREGPEDDHQRSAQRSVGGLRHAHAEGSAEVLAQRAANPGSREACNAASRCAAQPLAHVGADEARGAGADAGNLEPIKVRSETLTLRATRHTLWRDRHSLR